MHCQAESKSALTRERRQFTHATSATYRFKNLKKKWALTHFYFYSTLPITAYVYIYPFIRNLHRHNRPIGVAIIRAFLPMRSCTGIAKRGTDKQIHLQPQVIFTGTRRAVPKKKGGGVKDALPFCVYLHGISLGMSSPPQKNS